ncbi:PAS domain S-box protein [Saccharospirillum salsuginis]|uniref:PAS domain-containing protein n=1 Tax=Saccharospirillum salsuginis TaxID=418750 RepID=A0A918KBN1_9GAMM|nr:PAS domain S-box protein [Saccharospirillum salsuginis]GGX57694.1 hypothetical protein GCM10007392_26630 [Saccharospirillum salsuginis]
MPTITDESSLYTQLRDKAVAQLETGSTRTTGHWSMGVDALRLLHRLSSDPDHAEDAIKLLHELQVHQVELDLQNEAIQSHEHERVEVFQRYQALYERAPFAYFVVDVEGKVIQGNQAAAELFGIAPEQLEGQRISSFLNDRNRPQLLDLLRQVADSGMRRACVIEASEAESFSRPLTFQASRAPGQASILLACFEGVHAE